MSYGVTEGAGSSFESDDFAGIKRPTFLVGWGTQGSRVSVSTAAPLPTREPPKGSALSKSGTTMGAGSTTLAPANASRTIVEISNGSATQGIWLSFGSAAVSGQGTYLPPQATGFWPTTAAVFGIITGGGTTGGLVGWTEWGT